ncbi:ATP-binding protein [Vibrio cholerae]|nr:ATP-binding protein [Vibrio cholerae]EJL6889521.1 ATP-binding protein [Vibrio cholerae]EKF9425846.1 ATP-binding protein [Vibrio cholerae]
MQNINIYVDENGAGKSRKLAEIAQEAISAGRAVIAIATSLNDKYPKRRADKPYYYMGPRLGRSLAKQAIKSSIAKLNDKNGLLRLNTLLSILEYTNLKPQIGLKVKGFDENFDDSIDSIEFENVREKELVTTLCYQIRQFYDESREEVQWISNYSRFEYGLSGEVLSDLIKHEKLLIHYKLLRSTELYIHNQELILPIEKMSSGQLSLISTTFFIAAHLEDNTIILIDEPENSLHPDWQRQYIGNLKNLFPYQDFECHIATHSPMLIAGAVDEKFVEVFRHDGNKFKQIISDTKNIEDAYLDQFGIVTPENNALSERCIDIINNVDFGVISKSEAFKKIEEYKRKSYDIKQQEFLDGVYVIIKELEVHSG